MKNAELKTKIVIKSIPLSRVVAHPGNPNVMSEVTFRKLVRNIERTGLYEPIVVRPHPKEKDFFEIINGHHRVKALETIGYKQVDCVVWDVDDEQTEILLTTLNRLCGRDALSKRIAILNRLKERMGTVKLGKLLPLAAKQIERLTNMRMPSAPAKADGGSFLRPTVFFVTSQQQEIIEKAIETAAFSEQRTADRIQTSKAQRRAAGLTAIAERFLCNGEGR
jgi:hypothetical protein